MWAEQTAWDWEPIFDGIKTHDELPDASYIPLLIDAFGKAGFTSSQVDKILSGNVLRVYKEVLV